LHTIRDCGPEVGIYRVERVDLPVGTDGPEIEPVAAFISWQRQP